MDTIRWASYRLAVQCLKLPRGLPSKPKAWFSLAMQAQAQQLFFHCDNSFDASIRIRTLVLALLSVCMDSCASTCARTYVASETRLKYQPSHFLLTGLCKIEFPLTVWVSNIQMLLAGAFSLILLQLLGNLSVSLSTEQMKRSCLPSRKIHLSQSLPMLCNWCCRSTTGLTTRHTSPLSLEADGCQQQGCK